VEAGLVVVGVLIPVLVEVWVEAWPEQQAGLVVLTREQWGAWGLSSWEEELQVWCLGAVEGTACH